jgi:hypothetical protein
MKPTRPPFTLLLLSFFCLLGGLRIFLGAAALPLFDVNDELAHFDLVHKFARGYWPRLPQEKLDAETRRVNLLYGSPEYLSKPEQFGMKTFPPPIFMTLLPGEVNDFVTQNMPIYDQVFNHEAHSPPVYYAVGALWLRLGEFAGLRVPFAVYWVRFLNAFLYAGLIGLTYFFCLQYFSTTLARTVSLLVALFPNSIFFNVNSDVLSPLLVLGTLHLLLRWYNEEDVSARLSLGAGFVTAAALLTKLPNVTVLGPLALVLLLRWFRTAGREARAQERIAAALLVLSAGLPVFFWALRNKLVLGDYSGTTAKIKWLTWTPKPPGEIFEHPLFSWSGQRTFWAGLSRNAFNGESSWMTDNRYVSLCLVFFGCSATILLLTATAAWLVEGARNGLNISAGRSAAFPGQLVGVMSVSRLAEMFCLVITAGSILVLMVLSLLFDFGTCRGPSRDFPYFCSGRLVSGALVPFLILYVRGAEILFARLKMLGLLAILTVVLTMSLARLEFLTLAAHSKYNWFHLVQNRCP